MLNKNGYGMKPGSYAASYVGKPVKTDGTASDPAWANAPRTPRFVDMRTGTPAPLDTTASVLWDETNL
jgi:hypothetical protein